MSCQAIVYDAVGTLIHVKPSVAIIYAQVGAAFGSRHGEVELSQRFPVAFARQDQLAEEAHWRTSDALEELHWREIVAEVLDDVIDPAACFEALFTKFGQTDVWTCDPEAVDVLQAVQVRGFRQALASNFDHRLKGLIASMPIGPFLERVVISSDVGWRKPAPQFFDSLAACLHLDPGDILFVGDDPRNDFEPARRAGMRALLFDPKNRYPVTGIPRLRNLRDLLEML